MRLLMLEAFALRGNMPSEGGFEMSETTLILSQTPEFNLAVEQAFATGLRRHHALDDAKANRLGRLAQQKDKEVSFGRFSI